MKQHSFCKCLSVVLSMAMLLCALPVTVFGVTAADVWNGTATAYANGSGTARDPYLIENGTQLAYLAQQVENGVDYTGTFFKLASDIVLNDVTDADNWAEAAPTNEWLPIGTDADHAFKGTFDGDGHTVYGLYIDETAGAVGLFGYVSGAMIKNVAVADSYVRSDRQNASAGGVVGYADQSTLENVQNGAVVIGDASELLSDDHYGHLHVGGVVGYANAVTIKSCENNGSVSGYAVGYNDYPAVGGIVGWLESGSLEQCENNGTVGGDGENDAYFGGIVGHAAYAGTIARCVNNGNVQAKSQYVHVGGILGSCGNITISYCRNNGRVIGEGKCENDYAVAGGLIGLWNDGVLTNSENHGEVTANGTWVYAAGLVAQALGGSVSDCYNTAVIRASGETGYIGGLAALFNRGDMTSCYNVGKIEQTVTTHCVGGVVGKNGESTLTACYSLETTAIDNGQGKPLSEDDMKIKSSYADFDFIDTWHMNPTGTYPYPTLRGYRSPEDVINSVWSGTIADGFASGSGTKNDPYVIVNGAQLAYLAKQVNEVTSYKNTYFKLGANIFLNDLTNRESWGTTAPANTWVSIGKDETVSFSGHFDGAGYTIYGIYMKDKEAYKGLFGSIDGATVTNLAIGDAYIAHNMDVMDDCANNGGYPVGYTGTVAGISVNSTIEGCYASGYIGGYSANSFASGGIVGCSDGSRLIACVNACKVSGGYAGFPYQDNRVGMIGGIVGQAVLGTTIEDCENTAAIHNNVDFRNYTGGIVGYTADSTINRCHNRASLGGTTGGHYYSPTVGGIAAYASGCKITYSTNSGFMSGGWDVPTLGGIVGEAKNATEIAYCANSGDMEGWANGPRVGGVVGRLESSSVKNCYNTGAAIDDAYGVYAGGIAGYACNATIETCYNIGDSVDGGYDSSSWQVQFAGIVLTTKDTVLVKDCYYLQGVAEDNGYGTALSSEQLMTKDALIGFDFDSVWMFDTTSGYAYPVLREEPEDTMIVGDLNGNGSLNMMDVTCLFAVVGGTDNLGEISQKVADINGDGNVNMLDVVALYNTVSGKQANT